MKSQKILQSLALATAMLTSSAAFAAVPDSLYLFSYTPNQNGLTFAWSTDQQEWKPIVKDMFVVQSDYAAWGSEKKMHNPYLIQAPDGSWRAVWSLNDRTNQFATAISKDLITWIPQNYPYVTAPNCIEPIIENIPAGGFQVLFKSKDGNTYLTQSTDFKQFTKGIKIDEVAYRSRTVTLLVEGKEQRGQITKVPYSTVESLKVRGEYAKMRSALHNELAKDNPTRFAGIDKLEATVTIDAAKSKEISDKLLGIFFEDINYAADGGLYAELVQNRDFEYKKGENSRNENWDSKMAWSAEGCDFKVIHADPIHKNNPHYAQVKAAAPGASLTNSGFGGIAVKRGENYLFSCFAKITEGRKQKATISLVDEAGKVIAQKTVNVSGSNWKKYSTTLKAGATTAKTSLKIEFDQAGEIGLDMVSLFPQNTFKGRTNGMRKDLAETLADLKPRFMRFPGGCVAHGNGLQNMYNWKETIGPLEERVPQRNMWGYHQTKGLGYYEYFQFCEDLGAEPLPVIPAAVPCQNSSIGGGGQQGGVPMEDMPAFIQDILDLIEWANGDAKSTVWGRKRAEQGHPKPFNLKYIGIGNEDLISHVFEERFVMINKAVKAKYPDIQVCGTSGPFFEGSDYEEGWRIAKEQKVDLIDEHYYVPPAWFYYNQDFYDKYDRNQSRVYLGEYAAHVPGRHNCIETALAEAIQICSMERNGDIVELSSYAPLLAKEGNTQWNPDMIYFTNTEIRPTVGYFAHKMCGQSSGNQYIQSSLTVNNSKFGVRERLAVSTVHDSQSKATYIKLVNAMPCAVSAKISLENAAELVGSNLPREVEIEVLSGDPADKKARPVQKRLTLSETFEYEAPAYSLTIIKL